MAGGFAAVAAAFVAFGAVLAALAAFAACAAPGAMRHAATIRAASECLLRMNHLLVAAASPDPPAAVQKLSGLSCRDKRPSRSRATLVLSARRGPFCTIPSPRQKGCPAALRDRSSDGFDRPSPRSRPGGTPGRISSA